MATATNIDTQTSAERACRYIKVLANKYRLIIICKISDKPCTVSELIEFTGISQSLLSMHLAKLRKEKMVSTKREGKTIYYSIASKKLEKLIKHICVLFHPKT